ncbi:biopolymer transporter ExbD [Wohlfahrtiimonas chitiniclastica]|nr:biopolymer transporter ExbD [Wohlfahrtiimonas chitiniclastica]KZS23212.1 protein TolR [Wohlfahrtiimonas chitiniclastica]WHR55635.1 biopolymer transporter ExbD [Wohlfahrtiimonas chitiniclastica]
MMRRSRRKGNGKGLQAEMNIVPYVDVMFVLLTIFMVTATTISVGIDVDPPKMESSTAIAADNDDVMLVISVNDQGQFFFNHADDPNQAIPEMEITTMASRMFEENPNVKALVKGDKNAPYGRVIDAMSLLQSITQQNVQLMTSPMDE